MSDRLTAALRSVQQRRCLIALALGLAPVLALGWLLRVQLGPPAAAVLLIVAAIAGLLWAHADQRRHDLRWYLRALDTADRRFEDSATLLLSDSATLPPLAQLQQLRLRKRLADGLPDLRPRMPVAALTASLALAAITLLLSLWRTMPEPGSAAAVPAQTAAPALPVSLIHARLDLTPPPYTGLAPEHRETLDAHVPEGSRLQWQLVFAPTPRAVRVRFHDGQSIELVRDNERWTASTTLTSAMLYRIEIDADTALADDRRYRLDLIADQPPQIHVDVPDKTLSTLAPGQSSWEFEIRASDDYALGEATLEITHAQGSGENIQVRQQNQRLRGEGDVRQRRYRHRIELSRFALAPGDELIARFDIRDTRTPQPQLSRSASYLLRLPAPLADDSVGMEGLVRTAMPAFFRSQRQIIIDTEALVAEQTRLAPERFLAKSDALGVDQKILRLRYGQFLGEEFESSGQGGGQEHPPERGHPPSAGDQPEPGHPPGESESADSSNSGHAPDDGHDHATPTAPTRFGDAGNVLAEYGHTHDIAEAATLLDPETKEILRAALEQMWQAELELRSGRPAKALPYEYKALERIKQVQQATRIYLARVGLELPPVDEARRLSGERAGLRDSLSPAAAAAPADADLDAVWHNLRAETVPDWSRWDSWLRRRGSQATDTLDLAAAADNLRRDPACSTCLTALRTRLWPLLPRASAASSGRSAIGSTGRAYLESLPATKATP